MEPNKDGAKDSEESVGEALRLVAKALVKAGVIAYDKLRESVAQANTQLGSMLSEARTEMRAAPDTTNPQQDRTTERKDAKKRDSGVRKKRRPSQT
jgi:hypothetical protein